ncbi:hypothetical protein BDZ45DRAFT_749142 [Acephala macrosclerotiorum]|nr:hypothetical protein BDZ45DRAFT_749142 [Acephala macrosclerotiorum]
MLLLLTQQALRNRRNPILKACDVNQSLVTINISSKDEKQATTLDLFKLWVLAERFLVSRLQNVAIIEGVTTPTEEGISSMVEVLGHAYENGSENGALRKLAVSATVNILWGLQRTPKSDTKDALSQLVEEKSTRD